MSGPPLNVSGMEYSAYNYEEVVQPQLPSVGTVGLSLVAGMGSAAALGAVFTPINGGLVRWRANYSPLSAESTTLTSLWSTLKRAKDVEGWSGLWKGYIPPLMEAGFNLLAWIGMVSITIYMRPDIGAVPMSGLFQLGLRAACIPLRVLTNRAIVTAHKLPWSISGSLDMLLTPYERSCPWTLISPGLLALTAAPSVLQFIDPAPFLLTLPDDYLLPASMAITAATAVALVPLSVLEIRLGTQLNYGDELPSHEKVVSDKVVTIREERYKGLLDAVQMIVKEEGVGALFRGWVWSGILAFMS